MKKELRDKLLFKTFEEFCNRADEILQAFKIAVMYPTFSINEYKNYIYKGHRFSDNIERDMLAKDKCFEWVMSYKYESMNRNDLYSVLGWIGKDK